MGSNRSAGAGRRGAWGVAAVLGMLLSGGASPSLADGAEGCPLGFDLHVPAQLPASPALVVALHGCTQSAAEYAEQSGWNRLADRHGFVVLYPEQKTCGNSWRCFNWFDPAHILRGKGEVGAIKAKIDEVRAAHQIAPERIFVTGFSAGAASAVALLAAYPEVFQAGAVSAGLPYRIAASPNDAMPSMLMGKDKAPEAWGQLVRETHPGYAGGYPRLSVFHGTGDRTVNPLNQRELVEQWADLRGADLTPDETTTIAGHPREAFHGPDGTPSVVSYRIQGMAHALAVDPGEGPGQGGKVGTYAKDVGLFSSWLALLDWGLVSR